MHIIAPPPTGGRVAGDRKVSQLCGASSVFHGFVTVGVESLVTHYRMTSEAFFADRARGGLPPIDVAFIDGNHSYAAVRHDFLAVLQHVRRNSYILLHDTNIYVRELVRHAGIKRWMKTIARRKDDFEVLDFPFSSGVALVRVLRDGAWENIEE